MRRTGRVWRVVLALFLSALIAFDGMPTFSVWAEEPLGAPDASQVAWPSVAGIGSGDGGYEASGDAPDPTSVGDVRHPGGDATSDGAQGDAASTDERPTGAFGAPVAGDAGNTGDAGADGPASVDRPYADPIGAADPDGEGGVAPGAGDGPANEGDENSDGGTSEDLSTGADESDADPSAGDKDDVTDDAGEPQDPATDHEADTGASSGTDPDAVDRADGDESLASEQPSGTAEAAQDALPDEDDETTGDATAARDEDDEPTEEYVGGMLRGQAVTADGTWYEVDVAYDENARVPAGAELRVHVLDLGAGATLASEALAERVGQILELGRGDSLLDAAYLDIAIERDGLLVEPAGDVDVSIRTSAVAPRHAAYVEVARGTGDGRAPLPEDRIVPQDLTGAGEDATTLAFVSPWLGTFALASVGTRQVVWTGDGMEAALLLPRQSMGAYAVDADVPELMEGVDPLECVLFEVDPEPAHGMSLWLEAVPTENAGAAQDDDALGGVLVYGVHPGAEVVREDDLVCGPEGTGEPAELRAGEQRLLIVWDSGYRRTTLSMSDVVVQGMMPEGTQGTARDVADRYEDASGLLPDVGGSLAQEVYAGALELQTLAAYDITLTADGGEYEPDPDHPLDVSIRCEAVADAIAEGKSLQVWHVADDGSVEVVEDFQVLGDRVVFEAPGFSEYLLVAAGETPDEGLSATFKIKAQAKTHSRTTTVYLVDVDGTPLMGTVTSNFTVAYTGSGAESNETNTIDLYEFIDKLDPAIADEYDFSRVYVQLAPTVQKDFRYMHVADGTAIGQNASNLRAYLNMTGIEQNKSGQDYYGTWYQLDVGGKIDDTFIEYYHVAEATFRAVDTRGDPVEGAGFALYADPNCHTPFEYKDQVITAQSDRSGVVSFGKIPRGTYYMKETLIPEGYKQTTDIYTVELDGQTPIPDVVHEDDDGSVIISDILRMKLTKEWDDNRDHTNDSVVVDVYAQGRVEYSVTLDQSNDWTATLDGLDPNEAYIVSETAVLSDGTDVTNSWIPLIEYVEKDPHVEYFKADEFIKGRQYVVVTKTNGGSRALSADGGLKTQPITVDEDEGSLSGVTDAMVWEVETLTQDGVIALRNAATGEYLDQEPKWKLNPSYPVPLYIRHINDDGVVRFYYRPNLNNASSYYLYVWYGPSKEGQVDRYKDNVSQAAAFDIYRKYNVRSVDVNITNKVTRYPILIQNVSYPSALPVPGMTYDLYDERDYDELEPGETVAASLVAGADGYLRDAGGASELELSAGTYVLCQRSGLENQGFASQQRPLRFVITRNGTLRVSLDDQDFPDFEYRGTATVGGATLPVLRVPNSSGVTFEVTLQVEGGLADLTRPFEFAMSFPEGVDELLATVDGAPMTLTPEHNTFALAHGQTVRLENVPTASMYVLSQISPLVSGGSGDDGLYQTRAQASPQPGTRSTVTVDVAPDDARVVTLTGLLGMADDPARVTVTNSMPDATPPATGVADNVGLWGAVALVCAALVCALRLRRRV